MPALLFMEKDQLPTGIVARLLLMFFKNKSKNSQRRARDYDYYNDSSSDTDSRTFDGRSASPTAVIYRSELDYISRCILDYTNIETGGQLFGFWTSTGTPVVVYAIGPGRNSQHAPTSFFQDQDYLRQVGMELYSKYRLQHIGEWHSHHQMDLPHPSGGDVRTMLNGVGKPGFPRMLLCIGNCTPRQTVLNAFNFHEDDPYNFVHARWDIVEVASPYREPIDRDLRNMLIHPRTQRASHGELYTVRRNEPTNSDKPKVHWLTEHLENVETMKKFLSITKELFPQYDVKAEMKTSGEPYININNGMYEIVLPFGFPQKAPEIKVSNDGNAINRNAKWYNEPYALPQCFKLWIEDTMGLLDGEKPADSEEAQEETILIDQPVIPEANDAETQEAEEQPECLSPKRFSQKAERAALEHQVISHYFNDSDYLFVPNTEQPEYCYLALECNQTWNMLVKMEIGEDYPACPPKIGIGIFEKDKNLPLSDIIDCIEYRTLDEIIPQGDNLFNAMIEWTKKCSLLRAALVAYLLIYLNKKAKKDGVDHMDYVGPYIGDQPKLDEKLIEFRNKLQTRI